MKGNSKDDIIRYPSPLVIPVLMWVIGIFLGRNLEIPLFFIFCSFILTLILIFSIRNSRTVFIFVLIMISGSLNYYFNDNKPNNHLKNIFENNDPAVYDFSGIILNVRESETGRKYSHKYEVKTYSIGDIQAKGNFYFFTNEDNLEPGDFIQAKAFFNRFNSPGNPNSFDYKEYMYDSGIYANAYVQGHIRVIKNYYGSKDGFGAFVSKKLFSFNRMIENIRSYAEKNIESKMPEYSNLAKALILNMRQDFSGYQELFNQAGILHLIVISGLHTALISFLIFTVLNIFILNKNFIRIMVFFILIFYASICYWSPSVTRAVIFINLTMVSKILCRRVNPFNILAGTILIISIIDLNALFSVGLQLSVLSVTSIFFYIYYLRPNLLDSYSTLINKVNQKQKFFKIFYKFFDLILISIIVIIFISPLTMFYFNSINFNGVVGNLAGSLLISLILPLMFLLFLLPQSFILSIYFLSGLNFLIETLLIWAELVSQLPFNSVLAPLDSTGLFLIYLILILIITMLFFHNFKDKKKVFSLVIISAIFTSIFLFRYFVTCSDFKVIMFDAGTADINLISHKNRNILIDTGLPDGQWSHFKNTAEEYFKKNRISQFDWIIITHPHNDHYGGLEYIKQNYSIDKLVVNNDFPEVLPDFYEELSDIVDIFVIQDTVTLINDLLKLKIIHPDSRFKANNLNENSLVVKVYYKDKSFLFTGDLEYQGEIYLVDNYTDYLSVDVLKVGHHGSNTSSSLEFLIAVQPRLAFIPTAVPNQYHFPDQTVLENLLCFTDNVVVSGIDGALIIHNKRNRLIARTFKSERLFILD